MDLKDQITRLAKSLLTAGITVLAIMIMIILYYVLGVQFDFYSGESYRKNGYISDGTDGSSYKEAVDKLQLSFPDRSPLTFLLCTDGVQIHESNKKSAWPVFLVCEQIPKKLR